VWCADGVCRTPGNHNISLESGKSINIRDKFHGMSWNEQVDGPSIYGYSGGALGTFRPDGYKDALRWNRDGNVSVGGRLIVGGRDILDELDKLRRK
jgi:hypothetical protein